MLYSRNCSLHLKHSSLIKISHINPLLKYISKHVKTRTHWNIHTYASKQTYIGLLILTCIVNTSYSLNEPSIILFTIWYFCLKRFNGHKDLIIRVQWSILTLKRNILVTSNFSTHNSFYSCPLKRQKRHCHFSSAFCRLSSLSPELRLDLIKNSVLTGNSSQKRY